MSATARMRRRIVSPTQGLNPMGENTADFADKFEPVGGKNFFYIRYLNRGCAGSLQRTALRVEFPVKRENTGKFRRSSREGGKRARFSDYKSAGYAKIPYAPEQGIFWSQQGIVSRIAVNNSANQCGWGFRYTHPDVWSGRASQEAFGC